MKLLIKNGHIIDAKTGIDGVFDLIAEDGKIVEISGDIDAEGCEIVDAEGNRAAGARGCHCHLRDPVSNTRRTLRAAPGAQREALLPSHACPIRIRSSIANQS